MKERDVGGIRCSEVLALLSEYVDGSLDVMAGLLDQLRQETMER